MLTGMRIEQPVSHSHNITATISPNHPTIQSIPDVQNQVLHVFLVREAVLLNTIFSYFNHLD